MTLSQKQRQEFHLTIDSDGLSVVSLLADASGFSKQKIKECMRKGAVWLTHAKHTRRIRRASTTLKKGDEVHFYYDDNVLGQPCPEAILVEDKKDYSIWYKPFSMLSQGSKWSDHCTITRWSEQNLKPERPTFIVHRLDRATTGLIIVAHTKTMARTLTKAFEDRLVEKKYQAIVHGDHRLRPQPDTVREPVNEKSACSHFTCQAYDENADISLLDVAIETGRKHQIRQHLSGIAYPIVGDRQYGKKDELTPHTGLDLQLCAYQLRFECPLDKTVKTFELEQTYCLNVKAVAKAIIGPHLSG